MTDPYRPETATVEGFCCICGLLLTLTEILPFGHGHCEECATGRCYDPEGLRVCGAGICKATPLREDDAPCTDPSAD